MKKPIGILFVLALICSIAFAQAQGSPNAENMTERERAAAEAGQQILTQLRRELMQKTPEGVKLLIQERRQQMEQEIAGLEEVKQKVFRNQNEVRLAVHALLEMENITGGIGPEIKEIARNFNNSIQSTLNAEERIEKRSRIVRFFAGGDVKAAEELEREVSQNRQRIEEIKRLKDECDCKEEVRAMIQEQIQSMEREQDRLITLAQAEKKSKGLLGWIWK